MNWERWFEERIPDWVFITAISALVVALYLVVLL
jgi:hypothetical protein